jgi:hypothetical protein
MALSFPLCKTRFIVGWVEERNPTPLIYPPANVGLCLMPPARYRERHATRTLHSTQPTKIKLIFSSIRGAVEP